MRVKALVSSSGLSQAAFARKCDMDPGNFNCRVNGKNRFTDYYLLKIANGLGVSMKWLKEGVGTAYANEKSAGEAHMAELAGFMSVQGHATVNTINGENNSGTQTINSDGDRDILLQKLAMLEKMVADKDKEIAFLRGLLAK